MIWLRSLSTFVALLAGASSGIAADSARISSGLPDWAGLYIGAQGTYAKGDALIQSHTFAGAALLPASGVAFETRGALYGARVGYNVLTSDRGLVGIEADFSAGKIAGEGTSVNPATTAISLDRLASARFRIGYIFGELLIYGTGGVALARFEHTRIQLGSGGGRAPVGTEEKYSDVNSGAIFGAGAEWKISQASKLTAEYLHLPISTQASFPIAQTVRHLNLQLHMVRIGLNFQL